MPSRLPSVHIDLTKLDVEGKRAMVLMYGQATGEDLLGLHELPVMLRWLQRAAVIHDENQFAAEKGHRDTLARAG